MSVFKSEKFVPGAGVDLDIVAQDLVEHFQEQNYEVVYSQVDDRTWDVSITRGGMFKHAVGLKSALKVELEKRPKGTFVRAGAGVFGKQAVPTVITWFVAWPVLLTQVWGLIREAGLDNEAVMVVEMSINRILKSTRVTETGSSDGVQSGDRTAVGGTGADATISRPGRFCPNCGADGAPGALFCTTCGAAREPSQA